MKNPEKIVSRIKEIYKENGFYFGSFQTVNDNEEIEDIPMIENGELKMDLIERVAMELGVEIDEVLEADPDIIYLWEDKYPYIYDKVEFERRKARAYYDGAKPPKYEYDTDDDTPVSTELLLAAIFDIDLRTLQSKRYGKNFISRLKAELLKVNEVMPGTYHYDSEITNLEYYTKQFCYFPKIHRMVDEFINMLERTEELFFKALDEDLECEEIKEYNILVTALNLVDRVLTRENIYYDHVVKMRHLYKKEGYKKLLSFARQRTGYEFSPWECKEFWEDRELVQRFINHYPTTMPFIRDFGQKIEKIYCIFQWSDAPYIEFPEEEKIFDDDEGYYQKTSIYIPKTAEELGDDLEYVKLIKEYTKSSKIGGIEVPKLEFITGYNVNVIEWIMASKEV